MSSISLAHNLSEEDSRLLIVSIWVLVIVSADWAANIEVGKLLARVFYRATKSVGLVVWSTSTIPINSRRAITLVVSNSSSVWAVNRDLVVVGAKSVAMSIRIREKTTLKHLINRGLNTWYEVSGCEGDLLSFGKVVVRVLVEY